MPRLIATPSRVTAAGEPPKTIDEHVGLVNTGEQRLSVAHMRSPSGWSEPGQRPAFDEFTLVLRGELRVEHEAGELTVAAGQAVHAAAGEMLRDPHERVDHQGVHRPEQAPHRPGSGPAGELAGGEQRPDQHDPRGDPAEGLAGPDIVHRQTRGVGGEGGAARREMDVVAGGAQLRGERDEREQVAEQRGRHHEHAHGSPRSRRTAPTLPAEGGWPAGVRERRRRLPTSGSFVRRPTACLRPDLGTGRSAFRCTRPHLPRQDEGAGLARSAPLNQAAAGRRAVALWHSSILPARARTRTRGRLPGLGRAV